MRADAQRGKQDVQYRDDDVTVQVRPGYSFDNDSVTSDFIIAPHDGLNEHRHLVIDELGDTIYDQWNPNR